MRTSGLDKYLQKGGGSSRQVENLRFIPRFRETLREVASFRDRPEAIRTLAFETVLRAQGLQNQNVLNMIQQDMQVLPGTTTYDPNNFDVNNPSVQALAQLELKYQRENNGDATLRVNPVNTFIADAMRLITSIERENREYFLNMSIREEFMPQIEAHVTDPRIRERVFTQIARVICDPSVSPMDYRARLTGSLAGTGRGPATEQLHTLLAGHIGGAGAGLDTIITTIFDREFDAAGGAQPEFYNIVGQEIENINNDLLEKSAAPEPNTSTGSDAGGAPSGRRTHAGPGSDPAFSSARDPKNSLNQPNRLIGERAHREVARFAENFYHHFDGRLKPQTINLAVCAGMQIPSDSVTGANMAKMFDFIARGNRVATLRAQDLTFLENARVHSGEQLRAIEVSLREVMERADDEFLSGIRPELNAREERLLRSELEQDPTSTPYPTNPNVVELGWWNDVSGATTPRGATAHPAPGDAELPVDAFVRIDPTTRRSLRRGFKQVTTPGQPARSEQLSEALVNYLSRGRDQAVRRLVRAGEMHVIGQERPEVETPQEPEETGHGEGIHTMDLSEGQWDRRFRSGRATI